MISFLEFLVESKVINVDHEFGYGKVKVIHDPTKKHVDDLLNAGHSIRGTHTEHGMFIWKAADAIHHHIRNDLNKKRGFDIPSTPNSQSNSHRDFSIYPSNKTVYIQSSIGNNDPTKLKDKEKIFNHKSLVHLKSDYNCY